MKPGWRKASVSEILTLEYGRALPAADRMSVGRYPVYGANGEIGRTDKFNYDKPSIIVGRKGSAGEINLSAPKFWALDVTYYVVIDESAYDLRFIYYLLLTLDLPSMAKGVKPGINRNDVYGQQVTVPPLAEQKRIVAILDRVLGAITTAKANAERNRLNAKELADGSLAAVFDKQGSTWEKVSLQVLLDRGWVESHLDGNHGSEYPRKEEFVSSGVPYISANCLERDEVDMSQAKYLTAVRAGRIRKGIAMNGDVLFAHNATVGPVAILRTTEPFVILGTSLTYYRCNPRHILPDYLALYMRSSLFSKQYKQVMRQSTRNQVPITKQREFLHVIPPIREQQVAVSAVERMSGVSRLLEEVNSRRCQLLDELRSATVASGFAGTL